MGLLEVDTVGLRMLAAHCQSWAAEVGAQSVPASTGLSCQPTAAAVSAVHADVGIVAESMAGALQSTATKLTAASVNYSDTDEESATQLRELTTEV
jgi:Excreted virulence factor EspC, type VII ESX diderm